MIRLAPGRLRYALAGAAGALAPVGAAAAEPPLGYLRGDGPKAWPVVQLTWGLLAISIIVVLIFAILVPLGSWRRRSRLPGPIETVPVGRQASGLAWLYWGVGISTLVLLGSIVWTVVVLAAVAPIPAPPALTIEVTGQQWWWKARYLSSEPDEVFTTAGEFHIPVGEPVRVKLIGGDVIHSFWVPALAGKTETIPGLNNQTWIQADRPGRYRGQCTEYCGQQHAHMAFEVVAEPREAFDAWRAAQIAAAAPVASAEAQQGEHDFVIRCGVCHMVRGSEAGGVTGPDLTHLMSRRMLAGGVVTNTIANLSGWIANPQALKPDTRMPNLYLSGPELQSIRSYLVTLK